MVESTNLLSGGSDSDAPSDDLSTLDETEAANLLDEEEDHGEPKAEPETEPNSETDEPGEGQEAEGEKDEDAKSEEEPETKEVSAEDGVTVALKDGSKVPLAELTKGYLREQDYRRKTQELGSERRSFAERSAQLAKTTESIVEQLSSLIPKAPEQALAYTDPTAYVQQQAAHQTALAQLQTLLAKAGEAKSLGDTTTDEIRNERLSKSNDLILEAFPALKDRAKRQEADKKTFAFATDVMGFDAKELSGIEDGRMVVALHYARMGHEAEAAKKTAAIKVASKPPVTMPKKPARNGGDQGRQRQAWENFTKNPTVENAAYLDI